MLSDQRVQPDYGRGRARVHRVRRSSETRAPHPPAAARRVLLVGLLPGLQPCHVDALKAREEAHQSSSGEAQSGATVKKQRKSFAESNLEAARIILAADRERYRGAALEWAKLVLRQQAAPAPAGHLRTVPSNTAAVEKQTTLNFERSIRP